MTTRVSNGAHRTRNHDPGRDADFMGFFDGGDNVRKR